MAIIKIHFRGKKISDRVTVKLLIGGICIFILLIVMGGPVMWDWIVHSFIIWIGAMFFFIPFVYGFIFETFDAKRMVLMVTGIVIIALYCIYGHQSASSILQSVLESLVWMSMFSLVLDYIKQKIDF